MNSGQSAYVENVATVIPFTEELEQHLQEIRMRLIPNVNVLRERNDARLGLAPEGLSDEKTFEGHCIRERINLLLEGIRRELINLETEVERNNTF